MSDSFIPIESYRQALRNNKLITWYILPSMVVVIIALIIALISLFPLKTVKYKLYEFSSSGQTFHRIDSAQDLVSRQYLLMRMFARNYVSKREAIDRLTEKDRFYTISEVSSQDVFEDFKKSYKQVSKALSENGKRKITIELDNPFNNNWNSKVHIVEFTTEDLIGTNKTVRHWKAVIGYQLNQQKIRLDDEVQNPLGIQVTNYAITERHPLNKLER
jgi:type IV secretory pathway component VirB8